jgi:Protein of unknown function, DUF255
MLAKFTSRVEHDGGGLGVQNLIVLREREREPLHPSQLSPPSFWMRTHFVALTVARSSFRGGTFFTSRRSNLLQSTALLAMSASSPRTDSSEPKTPNKLINSTSPYLLQHAYNPVDWRVWGEEAFKEARDQDKPIFLSVGCSVSHHIYLVYGLYLFKAYITSD